MTPVRRMEIKRNNWKQKAIERATDLRESRKTIRRLRQQIESLKKDQSSKSVSVDPPQTPSSANRVTEIVLAGSQKSQHTLPLIESKNETRSVCVLMALRVGQSFRSIPRTLALFRPESWLPHFTSAINWVLRLGLALLQQVQYSTGQWVAIIDTSYSISGQRVLIILRVYLSRLWGKNIATPLSLNDVECIDMEVSRNFSGQKIKTILEKCFSKFGSPVAIIRDNGNDLKKGIDLLQETHNQREIQILEDVGHVASNALEHEYKNLDLFKFFRKIMSWISLRFRNTKLAFLMPPKQRTGRFFLGMLRVARWAKRMLCFLNKKDQILTSKLKEEQRQILQKFLGYRNFIERFFRDCEVIRCFLKIMKKRGLNSSSYRDAQDSLSQLPQKNKIRKRLTQWLDGHMDIQRDLGIKDKPLLVSSDIIESLFGRFKALFSRSPCGEFNHIVLLIPALCGQLEEPDIVKKLNAVNHGALLEWVAAHTQSSQWKLRQKFNQRSTIKTGVPNSGKQSPLAA